MPRKSAKSKRAQQKPRNSTGFTSAILTQVPKIVIDYTSVVNSSQLSHFQGLSNQAAHNIANTAASKELAVLKQENTERFSQRQQRIASMQEPEYESDFDDPLRHDREWHRQENCWVCRSQRSR